MNARCLRLRSAGSLLTLSLFALVMAWVYPRSAAAADLPVVTVTAPDPVASEAGPSTGLFVIARTGSTDSELSVSWTFGGTATLGTDYRTLPTSVTFQKGVKQVSLLVSPVDDNLTETNESVILTLSKATNSAGAATYTIGDSGSATVTIIDNDAVVPNQAPIVAISKPATGGQIPLGTSVQISAEAADPDGRIISVEFFANGQSVGSTTAIPYTRTWTPGFSGFYALTAKATDDGGLSTTSAPVSIQITAAPELPTVFMKLGELSSITETSSVPVPVYVFRTGPTNTAITVHLGISGTASNGVDYKKIADAIVLDKGQAGGVINIQPIPDSLTEPDETVELKLLASTGYNVGSPSNAVVTIKDVVKPPVLPAVSISLRDITTISETSTNPLLVWVNRTGSTTDALKIEYSIGGTASNGVDYATLPGNFVFPAGVATTNFPVQPIRDSIIEGDETVIISLKTNSTYAMGTPITVTAKIIDVVPPPTGQPTVSIYPADGAATEPGENKPADDIGRFTIYRTGNTNVEINVTYSIGGTAVNGVDYSLISSNVTLGKGVVYTNVLIIPLADKLVEDPETVRLEILPPVCPAIFPPPDSCYLVGASNSATVTIRDAAAPTPTIKITSPTTGSVFYNDAPIQITAESNVSTSIIQKVDFYAGTNLIGTVKAPPFTVAWSNPAAGTYNLTAKLTEANGEVLTSPFVGITVKTTPLSLVAISSREISSISETSSVPLLIWVSRNGSANQPLKIEYTISGTASNGVDYVTLPGSFVFPADVATTNFSLQPIKDSLVEGDETVTLTLKTNSTYGLWTPTSVTVKITDYIKGLPSVKIIAPTTGTKYGAPATFNIAATATFPDSYPVKASFYANSTLIGEQTVTYVRAPDPGTPYTFSTTWSNAPAGSYKLIAVATSATGATATSTDGLDVGVVGPDTNNVVNLVATDLLAFEPDTNNVAEFVVTRTGSTTGPLTVQYQISGTASNGIDYVQIPSSLTIAAGQSRASVRIVPIPDSIEEGTETIILTLLAGNGYQIGVSNSAFAHLLDTPPMPPIPGASGSAMVTMSRMLAVSPATSSVFVHPVPGLATVLTIIGSPGTQAVVESSDNLIDWTRRGVVTNSSGTAYFVDEEAKADGRFYRVTTTATATSAP